MDAKILERRTTKRTKMVATLKILGPDPQGPASTQLAHTLDISSSGAKIGAMRAEIEPGIILVLQHKQARAQCRVTWVRRMSSGEFQIGVEFLKPNAQFWGIDLDDERVGVWLATSNR
ncbi:MAG TPA: PilZ domain-containing protein [Terriglobales bacterium]|nr:PilZ domain-containing protein [Terriglobales bacterium]